MLFGFEAKDCLTVMHDKHRTKAYEQNLSSKKSHHVWNYFITIMQEFMIQNNLLLWFLWLTWWTIYCFDMHQCSLSTHQWMKNTSLYLQILVSVRTTTNLHSLGQNSSLGQIWLVLVGFRIKKLFLSISLNQKLLQSLGLGLQTPTLVSVISEFS